MQMTKVLLVAMATFLLVLAACAPETQNELSTEAPPEDNGPALATVVATESQPEKQVIPATNTPVPTGTGAEEGVVMPEETTPTDAEEGALVAPVEVDLGALTPEPTVVTTPREMPQPGSRDPLQGFLQQIKLDLAQRLNIDISEITIASTEEVTWRDSSLGCPEPGMGYLQVLTPGMRIVLSAQGENFYYHSDDMSRFVFCPQDQGTPPPGPLDQ